MHERDAQGVQAEGWVGDAMRLRFSELVVGQVRLLAADGQTEMLKMDTNLICPARDRTSLDE
jgi:hypothetical protein